MVDLESVARIPEAKVWPSLSGAASSDSMVVGRFAPASTRL